MIRKDKYQFIPCFSCLSILLLIFAFCFSRPAVSYAAKTRVWGTASTQTITATRPSYSPKIRSDRLALIIYFNNLNTAKSVSYELTYTANGLDQGVFGSTVAGDGNSTSKTLYFGTCSKGVCTPHRNIVGMRLVITAVLKNGSTLVKSYKIKP